ncbi:right-handed parallel beta-helix repeat-containing protein [Actinospica durhamensis]|uniref:Right-handed parallel beta-helix repeat-containing protein n=1 Tax=Actinospica durhamensis TaxID=1508375 RepID=A0A941EY25_9ACTN|nr:right-handed parallel beta-helix repeat-containing protein [Actinospica durhamensis]MBR7839341.1 right-handed parallel beta-helix repeat-containing protein [Actinospica durhamensis]
MDLRALKNFKGGALALMRRRAAALAFAVAAVGVIAPTQQAVAAAGATLYVNNVSPACTDAGSGTQAAPYCSIQAAANAATAGDTVLIYGSTAGGGTYDYTNGDPYAGGVKVTNSGTAAAPIVFKAAAGPYEISGGGDAFTIDGDYVEVSGADIVDASLAAFWVGGSHDTLDQDQTDTAGNPVYVGGGSDVTIQRSFLASSGIVAVVFSGSSTGAVLTTNAISIAGGGPKDYAVLVDASPDVDVTSNTIVVHGCGTGIGVLNGSVDAVIENNIVSADACDPSYASEQFALRVDAVSSATTSVGYNIYTTADGAFAPYFWGGTVYTAQAAFTAATGQGSEDLVEPGLGLGTTALPAASDPANGSANPAAPGELSTDAYGNAWPSPPDRGAVGLEELTNATAYADAYTAQQAEVQLDLQGVAWGTTPQVTVDWGDGSGLGGQLLIDTGTDQTADFSDYIVDSHMYARPGTYTIAVTLQDSVQTITRTTTVVMTGSSYMPVAPTRVLDTRKGLGAPKALIGPHGTIAVNVVKGVTLPVDSGTVTAAVINVTATDETASGIITAYPDGSDVPTSSNLNFHANENVPNLVTVKVGADGEVDFTNGSAASTDLIADVEGYYVQSASGSYYLPNSPDRMIDTRSGTGAAKAPVGPGGTITLSLPNCTQIVSGSAVTSTATAIAMNVTVVSPTANGLITVYPDKTAVPTASNLNYSMSETVPNMVVAKVGTDGRVAFRNTSSGSVELVVDVEGCYSSGLGTAFIPMDPVRVLDTRTGLGQIQASEPDGHNDLSWSYGDTALGSLTDALAVVMNVTVTQPQANGYVTVYPANGSARPPNASNLNFSTGETVPNLVMVATGFNGDFSQIELYNGSSAPTEPESTDG